MINGTKKRLALVTAVGVACFLAGRWSGTPPEATHPANGEHRGAGNGSELSTKRVSRDRSSEGGETGPKIPISKTKVEQILSRQIGHLPFYHLAQYMGPSLGLLGATEDETKSVMDAVARANEEILAEERRSVVIKEQTGTTLRLDLHGMKEPLEGIRSRLTEDIGQALPAESAQMLLGAIRWNHFYPEDQMDVAFTIERNKKLGNLQPMGRFYGYRDGIGAVRPPYKDDGTPIPADQVFQKRWAGLLAGQTLLPIDAPEQ